MRFTCTFCICFHFKWNEIELIQLKFLETWKHAIQIETKRDKLRVQTDSPVSFAVKIWISIEFRCTCEPTTVNNWIKTCQKAKHSCVDKSVCLARTRHSASHRSAIEGDITSWTDANAAVCEWRFGCASRCHMKTIVQMLTTRCSHNWTKTIWVWLCLCRILRVSVVKAVIIVVKSGFERRRLPIIDANFVSSSQKSLFYGYQTIDNCAHIHNSFELDNNIRFSDSQNFELKIGHNNIATVIYEFMFYFRFVFNQQKKKKTKQNWCACFGVHVKTT